MDLGLVSTLSLSAFWLALACSLPHVLAGTYLPRSRSPVAGWRLQREMGVTHTIMCVAPRLVILYVLYMNKSRESKYSITTVGKTRQCFNTSGSAEKHGFQSVFLYKFFSPYITRPPPHERKSSERHWAARARAGSMIQAPSHVYGDGPRGDIIAFRSLRLV